jgi:hypothetical protein
MRQFIALAGALVTAAAIASTVTARAQETPSGQQGPPAPSRTLELKLNAGYTQGFGSIAPGSSISGMAGPGLGIDIDADYRANPNWSLGLQGEYQEFVSNRAGSNRSAGARGIAGNVGATYHGKPEARGDPWIRLGTGYRGLWHVSAIGEPTTLTHGFELAKASVGYDLRVSSQVALAPQVGADLNLFVWRLQSGANAQLSSPQVGTFVFAGLQGRFDTQSPRSSQTRTSPASSAGSTRTSRGRQHTGQSSVYLW